MTATDAQLWLLALLRIKNVNWHVVAREAQRPDGLDRLLEHRAVEGSADAAETLAAIADTPADLLQRHRAEVERLVEEVALEGVRLTTVLDGDYPVNLRTIFNLPPFLFYRGELREDDARAVAVVGTRNPTTAGVARAEQMARLLVEHGVTVLSGLARGIDTAAHSAALESGGRTIAVLGSGIRKVYPAENAALAAEIESRGAVVSQFWPDAPPTRYSFPRRNVVTSGMGQGTVVVEASATSGAKMQARLALQHGKKVWLLSSLVQEYEWARKYLARGAVEADGVEVILGQLRTPAAIRERADSRMQLTLAV